MAILNDSAPPRVIVDPDEVGSYKWCSASQLIRDELHRLTPPQLYEMTRLRDADLDELMALIKLRRQLGIQRWCAYLRMTADGPMGCLPGDDLMPSNCDIYNHADLEHLDRTWEELEKSTTNFHRWHFTPDGNRSLLVNVRNYGQKYPSDDENVRLVGPKL